MENEYMALEELSHIFKSKRDLYDALVVDNELLLPIYSRFPIHFLRQLLSKEKSAIKLTQVINLKVPKYAELSPSKLWPWIKKLSDLEQYFSEMKRGEVPERDFMFKILSNLRPEKIQVLIKDARRQRSIVNRSEMEDQIEIYQDVKEELLNLFSQRRNNEVKSKLSPIERSQALSRQKQTE